MLTKLFQTPIWSGTASNKDDFVRRHEPGMNIWQDAYWWMPILALHTGARAEELAQLRHGDLKRDKNGIHYFEIHDRFDNRIKTANSVRNVPVHDFLIELGFPKLFRPERKLAAERIFPELTPRGREGKLSQLYSTHFSEYRNAGGLYEHLVDFHSFRRTFITTLEANHKIPTLVVARIAGHDDGDKELDKLRQTNDYTDYEIKHLKDVIDHIDYEKAGVDFERLRRTATCSTQARTGSP